MWLIYTYFKSKIAKQFANSGDPDLGLHCFPVTLFRVFRLKHKMEIIVLLENRILLHNLILYTVLRKFPEVRLKTYLSI